ATPGESLTLGDAALKVLAVPGDPQARRYLLAPDGMLFTGHCVAQALPDAVAWIAPARGFLLAPRQPALNPPSASPAEPR
ncbi:MAG TPA: hypothetical protein VLJ19_17605, partial [Variovorax sp.]|nr:hypothetical protein [Variovorax sp.]